MPNISSDIFLPFIKHSKNPRPQMVSAADSGTLASVNSDLKIGAGHIQMDGYVGENLDVKCTKP